MNLTNNQKKFLKYLMEERERLVTEYSNIYEDDLGNLRYVNEDIFNKVVEILEKYEVIIGVKD